MAIAPIFKKAYWTLAAAGALYLLGIGCLFSSVWLQRHALYAHKLHTAWWQDLDKPERFGFAKNQVTPFNIPTPDGEYLYAWHIVPLAVYAKNEAALLKEPAGPAPDITQSLAFKLLSRDPHARLIINFHGNAGHVAQGWRTDAYRSVSAATSDKIHVLTFDYRGFGSSTGNPTEQGIITDAVAVVDWVLRVARLPPDRVVLLGHSLGTAVTAAVAEHFATSSPRVEFAGVILVAAFTDLPTLLLTYAIGGIFPVLSPLRPYPALQRFAVSHAKDTWNTSQRLQHYVRASRKVRLYLIHAKNDFEIQWQHSEALFYVTTNATSSEGLTRQQIDKAKTTIHTGDGGSINTWNAGGTKVIREEIVPYGGHNRIVTYSPVALAISKAFGF